MRYLPPKIYGKFFHEKIENVVRYEETKIKDGFIYFAYLPGNIKIQLKTPSKPLPKPFVRTSL